jgi:hypothetical protein
MDGDFGRSSRGTVRRLANTAWERELNPAGLLPTSLV